MSRDHRLTELEVKLGELKHEYDLYLAGIRRTEPVALRNEVERDVQVLTRFPSSSTVFKFQVKTLAMRFRSLETQIKNLHEAKMQRVAASERPSEMPALSDIVVDAMAIENPAIITARVRSFLAQAGAKAALPAEMTPEALCSMMVNKAKTIVGKGSVLAIRYSLIEGDQGPRVKGELISGAETKAE